MSERSILWRRLDQSGHESARVFLADSRWHLAGAAVFAHDGAPCSLSYEVVCDAGWRTQRGRVTGWVGSAGIAIEVRADPARRWWLNGTECPDVAGAVDLDLEFSPSTNLLPMRRLGLSVGEEGLAHAAWLRFPSFALESLRQRYRRLAAGAYRYETEDGEFAAELEVDGAGLVTRYPGLCDAVAASAR